MMNRSLVYVVGLGPGGAQYLTAQAQTALQAADVLCGYTVYIDLVRPLYSDKEVYATGMTRELDRCRWALETAKGGKTVALVCSGDAGVYGMASPLLELAEEYPDVNVEVVPADRASAAGVLGAPLAHDFCVLSLSDRLTPWEVIERRLAAAAMGDFCIALYNPSPRGAGLSGAGGAHPAGKRQSTRNGLRHCAEHWPGGAGKPRSDAGCAGNHPGGYVHHRVCRQRPDPPAERADGHAAGVPRMRVVIFSGTTEGRMFSKQLAALGAEVLVSVATPLGAEEQGERSGITVHCGRLTPEEMTALLQGADLCVDATHPYAVEATRNIRAACKTAGTEYRRLLRPESPLPAGSMVFASAAHAAGFLARTQGNCPACHRGQGAFCLCCAGTGTAFSPCPAHPGGHCRLRGGRYPP